MAYIRLSIGQVGITQHLLIVLRKTTDPLTIYDSQSIPPPVSATQNITFEDIDPAVYHVDYRESPDGVALGDFRGSFQVDATRDNETLEMRFYKVGSGVGNAPDADTSILEDSYLDGKQFIVHKEMLGRPLVPPTEDYKEYDLVEGGRIELLNGAAWGLNEVIAIQIVNKVPASPVSGGRFASVVTVSVDTTLDSTYYDKRIRARTSGNDRLVITLDDIVNVPDGKGFLIMDGNGDQFQTKIKCASGDSFLYAGFTYSEITIGKGEFLEFEKRIIDSTAYWEVIRADPGIRMVGERFAGTWEDHPNTIPEDGREVDGDDYPRVWWWITTKLPLTHFIISDAIVDGTTPVPAGKEGLFVIHSTEKRFRMPNTQGLTERGLLDFDTYGADTGRVYDYPGGVQNEQMGQHTHTGLNIRSGSHSSSSSALAGAIKFLVNNAGDNAASQSDATTGNVTGSTGELRTKNAGVIYLRRI
jgi:hypothetical protein